MKHRRVPSKVSSPMEALAQRLQPASLLADVQRVWVDVVGPGMAAQGEPTSARQGTVTVTCKSSLWAQEIQLRGPEIVAGLNAALGQEVVVAVRATGTPGRGWARKG